MLADLHPEIARPAADPFNFGQGDDLDIQMSPDLDQLGRHDAHGTVVGGKGLVQLGHGPADGRGSLQQIDLKAGLGQIQGRLHTPNARPDHHDGAKGALGLSPLRGAGGVLAVLFTVFSHHFLPPPHCKPNDCNSPLGSIRCLGHQERASARPKARPISSVK